MADNINETIEDLRQAIIENTTKSGQCCQPKGNKTGSEPSTQQPQYGEPEDEYPTAQDFFDARCNSCNGIYDTKLGLIQWLQDNRIEYKAGLFGGLTGGLAFALVGAGPAGWAILASSVVVTTLIVYIVSQSFDFENLLLSFDDKHDELVLALYGASSVPMAKSNFLTVLGTATPTPDSAAIVLVGLMMGEDLLNQIFEPRSDMAIYQSPDPVDCGAAPLHVWSFVADGEGWLFEDESTGTQSATGTYVLAKQAWEVQLFCTAGGGGLGWGTMYLDGLTIAVDVGNSVQWDYGATSDGLNNFWQLIVLYDDTTQTVAQSSGSSSGAATLIASVPSAKTIEEIRILTRRGNGNWTPISDFLEVRIL